MSGRVLESPGGPEIMTKLPISRHKPGEIMSRLEDLKEGAYMRGVLPNERMIYRDDEPRIEIVAKTA